MWIRQIFWGSTQSKYLTDVCPSNIWGVYTPKIFHGCMSVKYFGGVYTPKNLTDVDASNIWGSTPPKYLIDVCPSNIWGLYTPKIFDGRGSVKYLGGLHPQNI